jgi:thioredoxin-related protein
MGTMGAGVANEPNSSGRSAIMDDMIRKAGEEGKLIMLEFYADWCAPCKIMKKTIFSDQEVIDMLSTNFISKMVNIDDLDGFELKSMYKVAVLPTILIFNTNGKMVERLEKTVSATEFLEILNLHNTHRNKVKIKHSINSAPPSVNNSKEKKSIQDNYLRYVDSTNKTTRNYRLQMGLFENYDNAFQKVDQLQDIFLEPIIVVNDYNSKEKVRYRVMMGEFATISEAESFRKILKNEFKLNAIIN